MKRIFVPLLLLLLTATASTAQDAKGITFEVTKNLDVFNTIYKNLDLMYVDTLNAQEVIGNGINAMLKSLDPYTVYYPESDVKDFEDDDYRFLCGIGALVRYHQN